MELFVLKKVSKIYPPYFKALVNINLTIEENEFLILTGATGAGKTTLLKLLYKDEAPTSGELFFRGVPYSRLNEKNLQQIRRKMGIVFQDHKLFMELTVYENIRLSLILAKKRVKNEKFLIYEFLERFSLAQKAQKCVKELSGGEQQKVGVIRALIRDPEILIADEPTGNLDPKSIREIITLFREFHDKGSTVILATHDPVILKEKLGRVVMLDKGELISHVEVPR